MSLTLTMLLHWLYLARSIRKNYKNSENVYLSSSEYCLRSSLEVRCLRLTIVDAVQFPYLVSRSVADAHLRVLPPIDDEVFSAFSSVSTLHCCSVNPTPCHSWPAEHSIVCADGTPFHRRSRQRCRQRHRRRDSTVVAATDCLPDDEWETSPRHVEALRSLRRRPSGDDARSEPARLPVLTGYDAIACLGDVYSDLFVTVIIMVYT